MINGKEIKNLQDILKLIAEYEIRSWAEKNGTAYGSRLGDWFRQLSEAEQQIVEDYVEINIKLMDKFYQDKGKIIIKKGASTLFRKWERLEDKRN